MDNELKKKHLLINMNMHEVGSILVELLSWNRPRVTHNIDMQDKLCGFILATAHFSSTSQNVYFFAKHKYIQTQDHTAWGNPEDYCTF